MGGQRVSDGGFQQCPRASGRARPGLTAERKWMQWVSFTRWFDGQRARHALDITGFYLICGQRREATDLSQKGMLPGCACILDGGYGSDAMREYVTQEGGNAVIPPGITRTSQIDFDKHTHKERHKVENLFQKLKRFRDGYQMRKNVTLLADMVAIAAILI